MIARLLELLGLLASVGVTITATILSPTVMLAWIITSLVVALVFGAFASRGGRA
jgi:hypothetical protein